MFIHKSSDVETLEIGEGTKIWHFCHIMPLVLIGKNCNIGQNVFIDNHVVIGNNCKIQNNVSLYTGVIVNDDVFIGPSVVFTNVRNPRAEISRRNQYKATIIEKGATIGANATILCGIKIGEYAFIGAGSVVTKDVKPYEIVYGNPAKVKGLVTKDLNEFGG